MSSRYSVSSSGYGSNQQLSGYPNYAYNGHEMTEFDGNNKRNMKKGTGNTSGYTPRNDPKNNSTLPIEDEDEIDRGHWGSKAEFILSCIGFSVGLGNVWRFPYLAYEHGGAAFIIPYFILLVLVGKPMYYMETAMGQFSRTSPLQLWRCAPIAVGVGFGMIVVSLIVSIYYNVIMSYAIIYIGASFVGISNDLPWTKCDPEYGANDNCVILNNQTVGILNQKRCNAELNIIENCTYKETSATQFWERYVLNITDGLKEFGDIGGFKYDLPLALLLSWIVVFLCLMKGVKSSGKVVYFTATFPYVILIALLIKGCTLPGAIEGLKFVFIPKWERLLDYKPWTAAASQMFFSLGISWGGLMMFGSYNKFHNKIHIDASVISSMDFFTSLISTCVIFSVLGNLSYELGVEVDKVAKGGQGLAFIVYPYALDKLPLSWLWGILFFSMLFFLGLDSEFALLETALTAIYDGYPKLRNHKAKITFVACSMCYLLGLPCVSDAGQYVLDIMDRFTATAVLWVGFWEVVGLMWIYGFKNVCKDIASMIGSPPSLFWQVLWVAICPLVLLIVFIVDMFDLANHKYGDIPYPDWAIGIGWGLVALSALQIPFWAIIMTIYYAIKGRMSNVIKPTRKWGPGDPAVRRAYLDEQAGIARNGRYTYDNEGMSYNYNM